MTGPNEPQDPNGHTAQNAHDPWAPPPSGYGSAPDAGQPASGQQWGSAGDGGSSQQWGQPAPGAGWGPPPAQPGGGPSPWAPPPGASQQWGPPGRSQPGNQGWGGQPAAPAWGQHPGSHTSPPAWGPPAGAGGQQPWGSPPPAAGWGQQPGTAPGWGPHPGGDGRQQPGPASPKSKLPLVLGGVAAVVVLAVVAVIAFLTLGAKTTLDAEAAQAGVAKVLTESYGATEVGDVSCPDDQEVQAGRSFECTLTVDGEHRSVSLTFTDDQGTYEVSRPN